MYSILDFNFFFFLKIFTQKEKNNFSLFLSHILTPIVFYGENVWFYAYQPLLII